MNYDYLKSVTAPKHMVIAIGEMGVAEIPGKGKSNPKIMQWAKDLGLEGIYHDDDEAWCAVFYNWVMLEAGRPTKFPGNNKYDFLRALRVQFSEGMIKVKKEDAAFGDTLVFSRPEGGHVGWYVGEEGKVFHVLGGNTGNMVKPAKIEKSRCVAVLRPVYITYKPDKMVVSIGGAISTNEA